MFLTSEGASSERGAWCSQLIESLFSLQDQHDHILRPPTGEGGASDVRHRELSSSSSSGI